MYVLIYLPIFNSIFNKSNLRMSIGYLQPLVILEIVVLQPDETRDEHVYIAANLYPYLCFCLWMCIRY